MLNFGAIFENTSQTNSDCFYSSLKLEIWYTAVATNILSPFRENEGLVKFLFLLLLLLWIYHCINHYIN